MHGRRGPWPRLGSVRCGWRRECACRRRKSPGRREAGPGVAGNHLFEHQGVDRLDEPADGRLRDRLVQPRPRVHPYADGLQLVPAQRPHELCGSDVTLHVGEFGEDVYGEHAGHRVLVSPRPAKIPRAPRDGVVRQRHHRPPDTRSSLRVAAAPPSGTGTRRNCPSGNCRDGLLPRDAPSECAPESAYPRTRRPAKGVRVAFDQRIGHHTAPDRTAKAAVRNGFDAGPPKAVPSDPASVPARNAGRLSRCLRASRRCTARIACNGQSSPGRCVAVLMDFALRMHILATAMPAAR